MKLVLFADDIVGLNIAQFLLDNYPEDLYLIVTMQRNDIYYAAKEREIPVSIFDSMDNLLSKYADEVDLGILAWWPKIIRSPLLEWPRYGFVNTHPSLLPYNRGKHSNFWALVEQAPFGVTLHRVDAGVDTGKIVSQLEIPYDWHDNGGTLYSKAQEAMVSLFCQTYPILRTAHYDSKPQNREFGSSHHSSEIEQASKIDLNGTYGGRDILNLLRARTFEGHPGCWFEDAESRYEISIHIKV